MQRRVKGERESNVLKGKNNLYSQRWQILRGRIQSTVNNNCHSIRKVKLISSIMQEYLQNSSIRHAHTEIGTIHAINRMHEEVEGIIERKYNMSRQIQPHKR